MKPAADNLAKIKDSSDTGIVLVESEFPIDVFPRQVQDFILDLHKTLNFPVDFTCGTIISALAVAIGNKYIAQLKPEYTQKAIIYMALVGRSGSSKSHPMDWITRPLIENDSELYKEYCKNFKDYKEGLIEELPVFKPTIITNATIEKLNDMHSNNPTGLGYFSDELMNFYNNLNRYSKGDDLTYWLSNWSGKGGRMDRLKDKEPQAPFEQCISILGGIQPKLVERLIQGDNLYNGFIERWLFSYPKIVRYQEVNDKHISPETIARWDKILRQIIDIEYNEDSISTVLKFSPEASEIYIKWQNLNADTINAKNDDILAKIQSKMEQYCIRLSLILEILYWSCGESTATAISGNSVVNAIKLTEHFRDISLKIVRTHQSRKRAYSVNQDMLYDNLPSEFETKEAISIGDKLDIKPRSVKGFLSDKEKYKKLGHGVYAKINSNGVAA